MTNGIKMKPEQFEELSLESKLDVLFDKAVENGALLHDIHESCTCREISCGKKFQELEQKVKTKNVIEKTISSTLGGVTGFIAGFFGGRVP